MRTVSAREANQGFSTILEQAVRGEEITITRRGVPVARLVPFSDASEAERRARRKAEALAWLEEGGLKGGVVADWTRDELYDRDADRRETPACG